MVDSPCSIEMTVAVEVSESDPTVPEVSELEDGPVAGPVVAENVDSVGQGRADEGEIVTQGHGLAVAISAGLRRGETVNERPGTRVEDIHFAWYRELSTRQPRTTHQQVRTVQCQGFTKAVIQATYGDGAF